MLRRLADGMYGPLLIVWLGSLWVVGYLVVPQLFSLLPDRVLAGRIAGELLRLTACLGLILAPVVLGLLWCQACDAGERLPVWIVLAVLAIGFGHLLALLLLQPEMAAMKAEAAPLDVMHSPLCERFSRWHGVASGIYLVQSLVAVALAIRCGVRRTAQP